ncbi:thioredoxin-like protein [Daldinia caldariorum]|uniref:thioredoxin-like protein n=1 Tax=Daldinia caldariorum TaxID=326644 RepID=UPI002007AC63|nr:thioredoxin-like protein [Daldinia caldariorum]KAI1472886.1 thioredoxin-like protein [Daldinia caldariorum]
MASIRDLLLPVDDMMSIDTAVKEEEEVTKTNGVSETTKFAVEFILDVICPYCYVGFKNLKAAMETYRARHPDATFEIVCLPFLLHPLAARSAYDKSDYLISRTRSPEYWASLGEAAGINFAWTGRTGSTRDAHKLLRFALERSPTPPRGGRSGWGAPTPSSSPRPPSTAINGSTSAHGPAPQLRLLEALFRAHHESDGDISDASTLAAIAAATTGFATAHVRRVLVDAGGEWGRAVEALVAQVSSPRGLAVRAVPTMVVNDRYVIGGVQSAEFLAEEFERIRRGGGAR